MLSQNFVRCNLDLNFYMLRMINSFLLLVLYVDYLLITGCSTLVIAIVKRILNERLFTIDIYPLHLFLVLDIS
jgi:hypothetical protein